MLDLMRDWWGVGRLLVMSTPAMMVVLAVPASGLAMVLAAIRRDSGLEPLDELVDDELLEQ